MSLPVKRVTKFLLTFLFLTILLNSCNSTDNYEESFAGTTMGTIYRVKLINNRNFKKNASEIHRKIKATLKTVNSQMSVFRKDSEINRINNSRSTSWLQVSEDLYNVIKHSIMISRMTDGAFDITAAKLISLWGFGPQGKITRQPDPGLIKNTLKNTGYKKIHLKEENSSFFYKKDLPEIKISLSAIAKGYGVDKIAELIESSGIQNFIVEIGGEIRAKGLNASGRHWRIGIAQPSEGSEMIHDSFIISDNSIATSGDYRNFIRLDKKTYSHIINPVTGKPFINKIASVTVISEKCSIADALATGLTVMGPDKAMNLAEKHNIPVLLILRTNNKFTDRSSSAFKKIRSKSR